MTFSEDANIVTQGSHLFDSKGIPFLLAFWGTDASFIIQNYADLLYT